MKFFSLFIICILFFGCHNEQSITKETTVLIKQYKGFPKNELDTITSILNQTFGIKTVISENEELYPNAYINVKSARYRADSIINFQKNELTDSIKYVFGLTSKDISTSKKDKNGNILKPEYKYQDWGIMGLAYCPGNSAIVSSFRLKHKNKVKYFDRLKKVSVHEFGHNLGLPHCPNKRCVMTDAVETVSTIDNANLELCEDCKIKLG